MQRHCCPRPSCASCLIPGCINFAGLRAYLVVVIVVLLKDGNLEGVLSESWDVFSLAQARDAGICGIFETREDAEAYMRELREEQRRNRWDSGNNMYTRRQSAG